MKKEQAELIETFDSTRHVREPWVRRLDLYRFSDYRTKVIALSRVLQATAQLFGCKAELNFK